MQQITPSFILVNQSGRSADSGRPGTIAPKPEMRSDLDASQPDSFESVLGEESSELARLEQEDTEAILLDDEASNSSVLHEVDRYDAPADSDEDAAAGPGTDLLLQHGPFQTAAPEESIAKSQSALLNSGDDLVAMTKMHQMTPIPKAPAAATLETPKTNINPSSSLNAVKRADKDGSMADFAAAGQGGVKHALHASEARLPISFQDRPNAGEVNRSIAGLAHPESALVRKDEPTPTVLGRDIASALLARPAETERSDVVGNIKLDTNSLLATTQGRPDTRILPADLAPLDRGANLTQGAVGQWVTSQDPELRQDNARPNQANAERGVDQFTVPAGSAIKSEAQNLHTSPASAAPVVRSRSQVTFAGSPDPTASDPVQKRITTSDQAVRLSVSLPKAALPQNAPLAGPIGQSVPELPGDRLITEPTLASEVRHSSDIQLSRSATDPIFARPELPRHVAVQLAQVIRQNASARAVEVALNPVELGRVRMAMQTSDGIVAVHIIADRQETLDLMRRHVDALAQEFRDIGYETSQFSFSQNTSNSGPTGDVASGDTSPQDADITAPDPAEGQVTTQLNVTTDRIDIRV